MNIWLGLQFIDWDIVIAHDYGIRHFSLWDDGQYLSISYAEMLEGKYLHQIWRQVVSLGCWDFSWNSILSLNCFSSLGERNLICKSYTTTPSSPFPLSHLEKLLGCHLKGKTGANGWMHSAFFTLSLLTCQLTFRSPKILIRSLGGWCGVTNSFWDLKKLEYPCYLLYNISSNALFLPPLSAYAIQDYCSTPSNGRVIHDSETIRTIVNRDLLYIISIVIAVIKLLLL